MTPLPITPLPSPAGAAALAAADDGGGFVDERVVREILSRPVAPTLGNAFEWRVIPANELDFAGWAAADACGSAPDPARRPAVPVVDEAGIGPAYDGTHRWWIAGVAGAFSTLLPALLLVSLGDSRDPEAVPVVSKPPPPAALVLDAPPPPYPHPAGAAR